MALDHEMGKKKRKVGGERRERLRRDKTRIEKRGTEEKGGKAEIRGRNGKEKDGGAGR